MDFPRGTNNKVSAYNVGDPASMPESGRSPREGNGNPLQYSCLENPIDRGAWQATYGTWGHKESDMTEQFHIHTHTHTHTHTYMWNESLCSTMETNTTI